MSIKMKELLKLARKAIEAEIDNRDVKVNEEIKKKYKQKQACFVTLTKNNQLRGCIGSLETKLPLWEDIVENAINAAFNDFRFQPVRKIELKNIKIEISILSQPKRLEYESPQDLLNKINKKMGIILKKDFHQATFLPQVWKQLTNKIGFLEQLSMKAGLDKDAWKSAEIFYYTVNIKRED